MSFYFCVALFLSLWAIDRPAYCQVAGNVQGCDGIFDFYILLDSSASISDNFRDQVVPFVSRLTSLYNEPELRISIITFSSEVIVHLNLTNIVNRAEVEGAIERLKNISLGSFTSLAPAFSAVARQIESRGGDRASVVLMLTDGVLFDSDNRLGIAVNEIHNQLGARVFVIGIGQVDRTQLEVVADNNDQVFIGNSFAFLDTVIQRIRDAICIEITDVTPSTICLGRNYQVQMNGSGFTNNLNRDRVSCRFKYTSSGMQLTSRPSETVTANTIVCPAPMFNMSGSVLLQVTLDGRTFIGSMVSLLVDDCKTVSSATPTQYCRGREPESVRITGTGYSVLLDQSQARCRYRTPSQPYFTVPTVPITETTIFCPVPKIPNYAGPVMLQATTNGNFYIDDVINIQIDDCTAFRSFSPSRWCVNDEVEEVRISGAGFTDNLIRENATCLFRTSNNERYVTRPSSVQLDLFVCPLPDVNFTAGITLYLQINNGFTSIGGEVAMKIDGCTKTDFTFIGWIFLAIIALLLLIGCCLLWCCIPLITGKIVGGLPPEKKEPTPEPPPTPPPPPPAPTPPPPKPGRKWEVVDASYYGGRGAGGMKPMKVTWGGKGATELGSKLTKAKDANLIEVVEIAGEETPEFVTPVPEIIPPPVAVEMSSKEPGCWDRFKKKVKRWYAVVSSYRPVFTNHGTIGKRILWFPGPNIQEKLNTAEQAEKGLSNGKGVHTFPQNGKVVHNNPSFSPTSSDAPMSPLSPDAPLPPVHHPPVSTSLRRAAPKPPGSSSSRRSVPEPPIHSSSRDNLLSD